MNRKLILFVLTICTLFTSVVVSAEEITLDYGRDNFAAFKEGDRVCYTNRPFSGNDKLFELKDDVYEYYKEIILDSEKCYVVDFNKYLKNTTMGEASEYIYFQSRILGFGDSKGNVFPIYYIRFSLSCSKQELEYGESAECAFSFYNPSTFNVARIMTYGPQGSGSYYVDEVLPYIVPEVEKVNFDINAEGFDISNVSASLNTVSGGAKYTVSNLTESRGNAATFTITSTDKSKIGTLTDVTIDNVEYQYFNNPEIISVPRVVANVGVVTSNDNIEGIVKGEAVTNPDTGVTTTNIVLGITIVCLLASIYVVLSKNDKFKNN